MESSSGATDSGTAASRHNKSGNSRALGEGMQIQFTAERSKVVSSLSSCARRAKLSCELFVTLCSSRSEQQQQQEQQQVLPFGSEADLMPAAAGEDGEDEEEELISSLAADVSLLLRLFLLLLRLPTRPSDKVRRCCGVVLGSPSSPKTSSSSSSTSSRSSLRARICRTLEANRLKVVSTDPKEWLAAKRREKDERRN